MVTNNAINLTLAGIVVYDGAGTFSAITITANDVLIGGTGNTIISVPLINGQVLVGSTGLAPVATTLSAGSGVSITNAAGSITINSSGGGLTWTVVTGTTQLALVNHGYIANNAGLVTVTLPATSAVGDVVAVTGINNNTGWKIAQNAGNQIFFGILSTTAGTGGSLASTKTFDTVYLLCTVANTNWTVTDSIGNITIV